MKLRGDNKFSRMVAALIKEDYDRRASLTLKLVRFVHAFDMVFDKQWDGAQHMIRAVTTDEFLTQGAYADWGAHDALIEAYTDLHAELTHQKLMDPDI